MTRLPWLFLLTLCLVPPAHAQLQFEWERSIGSVVAPQLMGGFDIVASERPLIAAPTLKEAPGKTQPTMSLLRLGATGWEPVPSWDGAARIRLALASDGRVAIAQQMEDRGLRVAWIDTNGQETIGRRFSFPTPGWELGRILVWPDRSIALVGAVTSGSEAQNLFGEGPVSVIRIDANITTASQTTFPNLKTTRVLLSRFPAEAAGARDIVLAASVTKSSQPGGGGSVVVRIAPDNQFKWQVPLDRMKLAQIAHNERTGATAVLVYFDDEYLPKIFSIGLGRKLQPGLIILGPDGRAAARRTLNPSEVGVPASITALGAREFLIASGLVSADRVGFALAVIGPDGALLHRFREGFRGIYTAFATVTNNRVAVLGIGGELAGFSSFAFDGELFFQMLSIRGETWSNVSNVVVQGLGTGVFVDKQRTVLTAHHVAAACPSIIVRGEDFATRAQRRKPASPGMKEEVLQAALASHDIAVLVGMHGRESEPAPFRDSPAAAGELVAAFGYPLRGASYVEPAVTIGYVNRLMVRPLPFVGGTVPTSVYQHSAAIQDGYSGGGLFDAMGRMVGLINSSLGIERGKFPQNVNFSLASMTVLEALERLFGIVVQPSQESRTLDPMALAAHASRFTVAVDCASPQP